MKVKNSQPQFKIYWFLKSETKRHNTVQLVTRKMQQNQSYFREGSKFFCVCSLWKEIEVSRMVGFTK